MSAQARSASARVGQVLREDPPSLDDLHRARLERRFVDAAAARVPAATGGVELALDAARHGARELVSVGHGRTPSGRAAWRGTTGRVALVAIAAAAVYLLAFRERGPSYAIERAGDGAIVAGTVIELGRGENAHAEVFHLSLDASASATLRFEAVRADDIRLALEHGLVRFAFHPEERGAEHVTIQTPTARVEIVGTELSVRVEAGVTEVSVTEGRVRVVPVSGAEPTFVSAGESVRVVDDGGAVRTATATAEPERTPAPAMPSGGSAGERAEAGSVDPSGDRGPDPEAAVGADLEVALDAENATEMIAVEGAPELAVAVASGGAASDSGPSPRARLERAEERLDVDRAAARRELRELASAGSPRDVRVNALNLLGESYADSHDTGDALRAYADAARLGRRTPSGATALYDGARLSERTGDVTAARAGYEQYLREYPDGANATTVRARLEALGGVVSGD